MLRSSGSGARGTRHAARSQEIWNQTFAALNRQSPEYRNAVDDEFTAESRSHCAELLRAIVAIASGRIHEIDPFAFVRRHAEWRARHQVPLVASLHAYRLPISDIPVHLLHRDFSFVAISRAPLLKLQAYASRMGWSFPWYSSNGSDFNFDQFVSFTPEQQAAGEAFYNYELRKIPTSDLVGISVFYKDGRGKVFHTYSAYARGVDMMNGAYHYLDLTPKGCDEAGLKHTMEWVRRHDEYGA